LASTGAIQRAVGQVPDSVQAPRGTLIEHVVDTMRSPVAGVDVAVTRDNDSLVVAAGTTDSQGTARLLQVPPGGPYTVVVRKIGYKPARTPDVHIRAGDALELSVVLQPYVVTLPEVEVAAKPRGWQGLFGIGLFKCLFLAGDENSARERGCTQNADAHAARLAAKEAAREVQRIVHRVQQAQKAGRRPDPNDALFVLNTARTCSKGVPKRPPWPRPDPDVQCREILKKIPRNILASLGEALAAIDTTDPFTEQVRRRDAAERRQVAEARNSKMAAMLAEAEARYLAQEVQAAATRVDQATKAGQRPDSVDANLVYDAMEACGGQVAEEEVYCRAILKRTSRKTLERLVSRLAGRPRPAGSP